MNRIDISIPSEDEFRSTLRNFFEQHGFSYEAVLAGSEERADFFVERDNARVLIELKIKGDDEAEAEQRELILEAGETYTDMLPSVRWNRLSNVVKKGVSQFNNTPGVWDFKVLWLHSAGHYADHNQDRFRANLYGMRFLFHRESLEEPKWCYYFDHSDFFRHRTELSAAVISESHEKSFQLCINDLHPRAGEFRASGFRRTFGDAYCDPPEFDAEGDAYLVDAPVNRNDQQAVLDYVTRKYGCGQVEPLDMALHVCGARVGEAPLASGSSSV